VHVHLLEAVRRFGDTAATAFGDMAPASIEPEGIRLVWLDLNRIYGNVFDWNGASARVLEKAGYQFEGRHRDAAVKDGRVVDNLVYAVVRDFKPGGGPAGPGRPSP